jgi:hypothetical protein
VAELDLEGIKALGGYECPIFSKWKVRGFRPPAGRCPACTPAAHSTSRHDDCRPISPCLRSWGPGPRAPRTAHVAGGDGITWGWHYMGMGRDGSRRRRQPLRTHAPARSRLARTGRPLSPPPPPPSPTLHPSLTPAAGRRCATWPTGRAPSRYLRSTPRLPTSTTAPTGRPSSAPPLPPSPARPHACPTTGHPRCTCKPSSAPHSLSGGSGGPPSARPPVLLPARRPCPRLEHPPPPLGACRLALEVQGWYRAQLEAQPVRFMETIAVRGERPCELTPLPAVFQHP